MSRSSSRSPKSFDLPRRCLLKALAAAPTAVAMASGQAFSSTLISDPRFAEVDRLIREINETCVAQHQASGTDNHDELSDKWFEAEEALADYATEIAAMPQKTEADALVLAKIADFLLVNDGPDIDGLDLFPCIQAAARAVLQARGIVPTEATARTIERDELATTVASRKPEPPQRHLPPGLQVGQFVLRIRNLGAALKTALERECALEDDSPQWREAGAQAERIEGELIALRDEILNGVANSNVRSRDDRFSFNAAEECAIHYELVTAFYSQHWIDSKHTDIGPVIGAMRAAGKSWADHFYDVADRWNASEGGASV